MADPSDLTLSLLGERLGLPLSFDSNGKCCLLFNEDLPISIEKKHYGWLFSGLLQDSVEWREKPFWQDLLALNASLAEQQAGAICYEPVSDVLLYTHSFPTALMDLDHAYEFLEGFINHLEKIINKLHDA